MCPITRASGGSWVVYTHADPLLFVLGDFVRLFVRNMIINIKLCAHPVKTKVARRPRCSNGAAPGDPANLGTLATRLLRCNRLGCPSPMLTRSADELFTLLIVRG